MRGPYFEADWRREALRTNLWLVPVIQTLGIVVVFGITYTVDRMAYDGWIQFPSWVLNGSGQQGQASDIAAYLEYLGVTASAPNQAPDLRGLTNTRIVVYNAAENRLPNTIKLLEQVLGVKSTRV